MSPLLNFLTMAILAICAGLTAVQIARRRTRRVYVQLALLGAVTVMLNVAFGFPAPDSRIYHRIIKTGSSGYVVTRTAAILTDPPPQGEKSGELPAATGLTVTGWVEGADWVRVARDGQELGFVHRDSIGDSQPADCPTTEAPDRMSPGCVFRDRRKDGRDCRECPEMVVLPAGSFEMGSTEAERAWANSVGAKPGWVDDEMPRHRAKISSPIGVGRFEVTRGQYAAFVRDSSYDSGKGCRKYDTRANRWKSNDVASWRAPGYAQTDEHPVVCVSWDDMRAYLKWLRNRTGQPYRLLSDTEWEYAARAKTETIRYWGDDRGNNRACAFANVGDRTRAAAHNLRRTIDNIFLCRDGDIFTAKVGSHLKNGFGLYDMLGNVWEWVEDCHRTLYRDLPGDGRAWTTKGCSRRVIRGGSWYYPPGFLRAAGRTGVVPGAATRSGDLGFRVARTLAGTVTSVRHGP